MNAVGSTKALLFFFFVGTQRKLDLIYVCIVCDLEHSVFCNMKVTGLELFIHRSHFQRINILMKHTSR